MPTNLCYSALIRHSDALPTETFDKLQHHYRAWLIDGLFPADPRGLSYAVRS